MSRLRVTVALDDDGLNDADRCLTDLREHGLHITKVQRLIGTVTGDVEATLVGALRELPGVAAVEADREVHLLEGGSASAAVVGGTDGPRARDGRGLAGADVPPRDQPGPDVGRGQR